MNWNKNKLRSVVTHDNVQTILRIWTAKFNPDIAGLFAMKKCKTSQKS